MSAILEVKDLSIHFGGLKAVDKVDLVAEKGEITALIGPNGAGKTTMFNLIAGFYTPTEGSIIFDGKDITNLKSFERTKIGMARTFQNINLFKNMTVMENALVGLHTRMKADPISCMLHLPNMRKEEKHAREEMMDILDLLGLADVAEERAGSLPYGKQKNLEIARAVATQPKLLLLDEPSTGLAPLFIKGIFDTLVNIRSTGTTVLLVEQNAKMALGIADRGYVIKNGSIVMEDSGANLLNNEDVRRAYLGGGK